MADAANAAGADRTYPMYVGGRWVETDDRRPVVSPADGSVLGSVCAGDRATVEEAVRAARQASSVLAGMSAFERADLCYAIADEIGRDADVLAPLLSLEQGKPLHSEARGEVAGAATVFRDAAEQAKWSPAGTILATRDPRKRVLVERRPRGVYGTITPWNSPLGVACGYYMAPAIATGNTIVWLPALSTSAISSRLCECLDRAGLPVGTVNLVIGDGPVVGDAIVTHPGVDAIGFTGGSRTGRIVAEHAGLKPRFMELGGNGPTVVLEDADLELAAGGVGSVHQRRPDLHGHRAGDRARSGGRGAGEPAGRDRIAGRARPPAAGADDHGNRAHQGCGGAGGHAVAGGRADRRRRAGWRRHPCGHAHRSLRRADRRRPRRHRSRPESQRNVRARGPDAPVCG